MRIRLTRDSVAAGDDADAPHTRLIDIADAETAHEVVDLVFDKLALAAISGGQATWGLKSNVMLAVVAQHWTAPRKLPWTGGTIHALAWSGDVLNMHAVYFAQIPPEMVFEVLRRAR